ncbi:alpha/beta fold hydrolase [Nocardia altamirensis]|uniref:alpha/beta fold hydrolase n=1 Tax=Nocardia altamirensis TaxID=472158 RepID=UPI00114D045B|nr:alpha/beta hydrolase [Nocardia altamirensis]
MTEAVSELLDRVDRDTGRLAGAMRQLDCPDGVTRPVATFGRGTPIVCVPLLPELNFVYAPHIDALSADHEVVLYEPVVSRSCRITVEDRVRELRCVLDALGLDSAHLLAWSDAGAVAYRFAAAYPAHARSAALLVLPDRYRLRPPPMQAITTLLYRRPIERLVPDAMVRLLLGYFLGGPGAPPRLLRTRAKQVPQFPRLFKHSMLPMFFDHLPEAGELHCPALLLSGDRSRIVTVDQARRMAELIGPGAEFRFVPGGEHFLGYIATEPVDRALRDFYARVGVS